MTSIADAAPIPAPTPIIEGRRPAFQQTLIYVFVLLPMIALVAAVPVAWGWGVFWQDLALLVAFYVVGCLGITVGYHRYFTHKSFKARPWLRVIMAISGSLAMQGPVRALGRRPPPAPCLLRQGRRPALAVAVRHLAGRGRQGLLALPHGLAVRPGRDQRRAVRPRPARRPGDHAGVPQLRLVGGGQPAAAGRRRRADHLVVVGRAHRRSSGAGWSGWPCCTTSPGRSTRSVTCSASGRSGPGTSRATSGRWRC